MTNKEILQASLLDIVFDNRNKAYGAYALRRYYPNRLLVAISISISLAILFLLLSFLGFKKQSEVFNPIQEGNTVIIREYNIPQPELPQPTNPRPLQVAQVDYQPPVIVPDHQVTESQPTTDDLINSAISNINLHGQPPTDIVIINNNPITTTGNGEQEVITTEPQIIIPSTDPEYPGGRDALVRFLELNLIVPDELEVGNRKTVQVKFKINEEGKISDIEIAKSAGETFDKEVIRVCKKMKRWRPATQNGKSVSTTFLLPVTFVATEQ
jgi:protein TonB